MRLKFKNNRILILLPALILIWSAYILKLNGTLDSFFDKVGGRKTVSDRIAEFSSSYEIRLRPLMNQKGIVSFPENVTLVFFKDTKVLNLYAGNSNDLKFITTYEVKGASGGMGPKLAEGDRQVPEGIYGIEALNPNSRFHLALRVNYPSLFDRMKGIQDGRIRLGTDIMIHGNSASIGCLAMGDEVIEELFVLAGNTKYRNWKVILAPTDLRVNPIEAVPQNEKSPNWIRELYTEIKEELEKLPST